MAALLNADVFEDYLQMETEFCRTSVRHGGLFILDTTGYPVRRDVEAERMQLEVARPTNRGLYFSSLDRAICRIAILP